MTLKAKLAGTALALGFSVSLVAAPLFTIEHDYGTSTYTPPSLGAGTCDTLNSNSVTVRTGSNCQRFYDTFDFSDMTFGEITHFELTVSVSGTSNQLINESWRVRPGVSATEAPNPPAGNVLPNNGTQTFVFNEGNLSVFQDIVDNGAFYLWFSQYGLQWPSDHNFTLHSASLSAYGTAAAVPEAGSLGLLALGLVALGVARRRQQPAV